MDWERVFKQNEALWDRSFRAMIGMALVWLFTRWHFEGAFNWLILLAGLILVSTAGTGHSFAYTVLGIDTRKWSQQMK